MWMNKPERPAGAVCALAAGEIDCANRGPSLRCATFDTGSRPMHNIHFKPSPSDVPRALLELARGQEQQRWLLPTPGAQDLREGGCEFGIHYRPDDWVGGDYVDVVALGP